jgi:hypothetical protein
MFLARTQALQKKRVTGNKQRFLGTKNLKDREKRSAQYTTVKKNRMESSYNLAMSDKTYCKGRE